MVECTGKSVNFGVRQAHGNADRPIPGCLTWTAHATLCFTVSFLHRGTIHKCLALLLAHEGCLMMWSSYYWAELEEDSLAAAFLSLLLSLTLAQGGRPCPPLHVNWAHHLKPGFSPSFPETLPLRILLQSPVSPPNPWDTSQCNIYASYSWANLGHDFYWSYLVFLAWFLVSVFRGLCITSLTWL